jgi:hypothetical protein
MFTIGEENNRYNFIIDGVVGIGDDCVNSIRFVYPEEGYKDYNNEIIPALNKLSVYVKEVKYIECIAGQSDGIYAKWYAIEEITLQRREYIDGIYWCIRIYNSENGLTYNIYKSFVAINSNADNLNLGETIIKYVKN